MITKAQIETLRRNLIEKVNTAIDELLANPDTFLEDLSESVKTVEQVNAERSDEPEIPTKTEMAEILKEKLDLKPEGEDKHLKEVDEAIWERTIKGLFLKEGWTSEKLIEALKGQNYDVSKKNERRLKELEGIKGMMLRKELDLDAATSQVCVREEEKGIVTEFALLRGL